MGCVAPWVLAMKSRCPRLIPVALVENPLLMRVMNDPLTETRRLVKEALTRGAIEYDESVYIETVLNLHQLMPSHNRVKSDFKSMMKIYFMLDTLLFVKEELNLVDLYDIVRKDFRMILVCNDTFYPTRTLLQMGVTGYEYWNAHVGEDVRKEGLESLVDSLDDSYVAKCCWLFDILMEVCIARHFRNDTYTATICRMLESVKWNRETIRRDSMVLGNLRLFSRYYPITYSNRPFDVQDFTIYYQWIHSITMNLDQQAKKFARTLMGDRRVNMW